MNNFLIIANKQKDINLEITEQIKHHITRMGAVCNVYDQYNRNVTSIDIPEGTQCILVIGGDGTILAAARMLGHIPDESGFRNSRISDENAHGNGLLRQYTENRRWLPHR